MLVKLAWLQLCMLKLMPETCRLTKHENKVKLTVSWHTSYLYVKILYNPSGLLVKKLTSKHLGLNASFKL